jgi:hypothetical protein
VRACLTLSSNATRKVIDSNAQKAYQLRFRNNCHAERVSVEWVASTGFSPGRGTGLTPQKALRLWHDVALTRVRGQVGDLTERQMLILLTIYLETPPHTVRGLAAKLGVTKPVITRALDTMGAMGLVSRKRDEADGAMWLSSARSMARSMSRPGRNDC